jgi:hypothetical protein
MCFGLFAEIPAENCSIQPTKPSDVAQQPRANEAGQRRGTREDDGPWCHATASSRSGPDAECWAEHGSRPWSGLSSRLRWWDAWHDAEPPRTDARRSRHAHGRPSEFDGSDGRPNECSNGSWFRPLEFRKFFCGSFFFNYQHSLCSDAIACECPRDIK